MRFRNAIAMILRIFAANVDEHHRKCRSQSLPQLAALLLEVPDKDHMGSRESWNSCLRTTISRSITSLVPSHITLSRCYIDKMHDGSEDM